MTMFEDTHQDDSGDVEQNGEDPYGFVGSNTDSGEESEDAAEEEEPFRVRKWNLGDHSTAGAAAQGMVQGIIDGLDGDVDDDLRSVLEEAQGMVPSSVNNFECPNCGLNHGHSDTKHDIRSGFNVTAGFADEMEDVPYCHCGVNELAMLMDFFGYIQVPVFEDEHQFEGVLKLDNDVLQDVLQTREEVQAPRGNDMEKAVFDSGNEFEINPEMYEDLEIFYQRYREIKSAANNAPIPSDTRNEIEARRETLEEATA